VALRILVVDDDVTTLEVLGSLLGAEGFKVQKTQKPSDAIGLLQQAQFDILLTDLVMAEMGGLQLIEAARGLQPDLRCCVMSGHPRSPDARDDVRWISKPLDFDDVLDVLAAA
jgi:DNA-binding NtrC family response regulator